MTEDEAWYENLVGPAARPRNATPFPRGTEFSYLLPACYLPVTRQRYKGAGWCVPGAHNPLLRFTLGAGKTSLTL